MEGNYRDFSGRRRPFRKIGISTPNDFNYLELKTFSLNANYLKNKLVGEIGFEPTTLWSQTRCATRLRYSPTVFDEVSC